MIFNRNGKKVREGRERQGRQGEEGRGRTHSCVERLSVAAQSKKRSPKPMEGPRVGWQVL